MRKDIFIKSLQSIPFSEKFLFSCLYEPTIHPQFFELLDILPVRYKNKIFFTTNLVKYLSDDELEKLACSKVDHINVSLETFDRDKYKILTSTDKSFFYENLERMTNIFSQYPLSPKIHFITMILRDNFEELIDIAKLAHDRFNPYLHEFRVPYFFYHPGKEDIIRSLYLPKGELKAVISQLKSLGFNLVVSWEMDAEEVNRNLDNLINSANTRETRKDSASLSVSAKTVPAGWYDLRFYSDGSGIFLGDSSSFDLKDIDQPFLFYQQNLIRLQQMEANIYLEKDELEQKHIQNRTEQNRTEQNRTEQNRTEHLLCSRFC
jgi:MoaA/NifB/PqqE/SkfB family radical SAM enzyme